MGREKEREKGNTSTYLWEREWDEGTDSKKRNKTFYPTYCIIA